MNDETSKDRDRLKAICMETLPSASRIIVSKEQVRDIYCQVLCKKSPVEHHLKIFETLIKEVIASPLLENTIESTAAHMWEKRKEFKYLKENEKGFFEKLLKICGEIYSDFPEFFDPGDLTIGYCMESLTKPYLTALSFCKDRMVASGFLQNKEHDLITIKEDYAAAAILSLNVKAFNSMFDFDNGLSCAKADRYIGDVFDKNKEDQDQYISLGDLSLKESKHFESYKTTLKKTISTMQDWRTLAKDKRKEEIEKFMTQILTIYLECFQKMSSSEAIVDILSNNDKKILKKNLGFIQEDYVDQKFIHISALEEVDTDIERSYTTYTVSNWIWNEEISLTRSKIESFNWMFREIAKLEQKDIVAVMLDDGPWTCPNDVKARPKHIPATHWWWFT